MFLNNTIYDNTIEFCKCILLILSSVKGKQHLRWQSAFIMTKKIFFEDFDIFSSLGTYTYLLALTKRICSIYDQNSQNVEFPKASGNAENKIFLSNHFSLVTKAFSHLLLLYLYLMKLTLNVFS